MKHVTKTFAFAFTAIVALTAFQQTAEAACGVTLRFSASSEKESWLETVNKGFNDNGKYVTNTKKTICIDTKVAGSAENVASLTEGTAEIASPASSVYIELAKDAKGQAQGFVVPKSPSLVISPIVIAMWNRMAQVLKGLDPTEEEASAKKWAEDPTLSWNAILSLVKEPTGWAARGRKGWGKFKWGHTHPDYSNSGIFSVLAEVYAAIGKQNAAPTLEDIANPNVGTFVQEIEKAVVHYGESTGFFAKSLYSNGPTYLSAAVLYESSVVEYYLKKNQKQIPEWDQDLVAVYPAEGTFYSDHPLLFSAKLTPEQQSAAQVYLNYLREESQQEAAMKLGFRPANPDVEFSSPLDVAHGVNTKFPTHVLQTPKADVINGMRNLWQQSKKRSHVVLIIDTSGSMKENGRIAGAKNAANALVSALQPEDSISFMHFSTNFDWLEKRLKMSAQSSKQMKNDISDLTPDGGTAFFDAVGEGYNYLLSLPSDERDANINAIVVLTDGDDRDSKMKFADLVAKIGGSTEVAAPVKIFTVGVGTGLSEDAKKALKTIADTTKAKTYFSAEAKDVVKAFREISTFF